MFRQLLSDLSIHVISKSLDQEYFTNLLSNQLILNIWRQILHFILFGMEYSHMFL